MVERLPGEGVPSELIAEVLHVQDPEAAALARALLPALEKIDPELVPQVYRHPLLEHIQRGVRAAPALLAAYRKSRSEDDRALVLDALAHIADAEPVTGEVIEALQKVMAGTKSPRLASLAARALATAGEEGFVAQQRGFLASEALREVRLSARLLGYARDPASVEPLSALLNAKKGAAHDVVIWALGEIGDPHALPALHRMLEVFAQLEATCAALGKIGSIASLPRLLPVLAGADAPQRAAAAEAIARIVFAHGSAGDAELDAQLRRQLEQAVERDTQPRVRLFGILGISVLGGGLPPARILERLGGDLGEEGRRAMKTLVGRKAPVKPKGRRRPRTLV